MVFSNAKIILCKSDILMFNCSVAFKSINFKRFAIMSCISISNKDPRLMDKKCLNSLLEFFPAPSAIFDGIDTAVLFV
jgi:hypothetical protein